MTRIPESLVSRQLDNELFNQRESSRLNSRFNKEKNKHWNSVLSKNIGSTIKSLMVVLVVLLGVLCTTHSTLAQTAHECPVPSDTDPVEDPTVTAQQADADSTNLGDFTREVRDRFKNYSLTVTTMTQIAYFGCVLRQDGGPWRTDSVYPIMLTPFGRVVFHTKDMTLSGRLLNPAILASIYTSLGVSRSDIAALGSSDQAIVAQARLSILTKLAEEGDAAFDATTPIPGVRPGIPGASGHVAVYVGRAFRIPLIVLGGFDLNANHVVEEAIDYGNPSVTASEVVNRETLKQFVIEAGNFFIRAQESSSDGLLGSQVKVAMRDPNGPWRHGSVYIYVLDLRSDIVFIHGANPNRWEFFPLIGTARDSVTGELILPQILEAAKSDPEGGFLRYYFDDPTDPNDSAGTPKVGYAREFAGSIPTAGGGVIPTNYVVGSGFYLTSPEVVALRQNQVVQAVLPQLMRSITASTVNAITDRIQQTNSDSSASSSTAFKFGRVFSLNRALSVRSHGSFFSAWLAEEPYFMVPLNATNNGLLSNLTLWGNAEFRNLSDDNMQVMAYEGNVTSANVGVDRRVGENAVGGVSMTLASGSVDYTDPELAMGELSTSITSINPYLGWQMANGAQLWAVAGFGWGEVEFEEPTNSQASDLSQTMFAAGVNLSLMSSDQLFGGGTTSLNLNSEAAITNAEVDEGGSLENTTLNASRYRVMFEGLYTKKLASNAVLTPSIEAGLRHDGGDGTTGSGFEFGAGLGYSVGRLEVNLNSQSLLTHSDAEDYQDWSLSGTVALKPSSDGQGLSMSLGSTLGLKSKEFGALTLESLNDTLELAQHDTTQISSPSIHATVRYDFNRLNGLGLWSSYHSTDNTNQYRVLQLGLQFRSVQGFNAGLEIGRKESIYRTPYHSIQLRGALRW